MTKISTFNSNNLDVIRTAINAKLAEVSQELGIAINMGGMSFSSQQATTRLTFKAVSEEMKEGESIEEASARSEFATYARSFGLKPEDFGKEVKVDGRKFRIVGIKPRSRKFPVLGEDLINNSVYKLSAIAIKDQLHAANVQ